MLGSETMGERAGGAGRRTVGSAVPTCSKIVLAIAVAGDCSWSRCILLTQGRGEGGRLWELGVGLGHDVMSGGRAGEREALGRLGITDVDNDHAQCTQA